MRPKKLFSALMLLKLKTFVDGQVTTTLKASANVIHLYSETSVVPIKVLFLIKR